MSTTQRTLAQYDRYIAEQYEIAVQHGLQFNTPEHIARLACVDPRDLTLKLPSSSSKSKSKRSRKWSRKSKATSSRSARSLANIRSAAIKSIIFEQAREAQRRVDIPVMPPGSFRILQTIVPDPLYSIVFSNYGVEGVPQAVYETLDGIDGCNDPIVFPGVPLEVPFIIAWPGYKPYEVSLDLRKPDEATLCLTKRPICRSELARDVLGIFTEWFLDQSTSLARPETEELVPLEWKLRGESQGLDLNKTWLTKFGPSLQGDGCFVAEFHVQKPDSST